MAAVGLSTRVRWHLMRPGAVDPDPLRGEAQLLVVSLGFQFSLEI